ncbi:hypothetical protein Pelo_16671 [Pelomyxa schiedti]|nr:hypothetical protein Pelo_16671 [Pelomyxa schiedti]
MASSLPGTTTATSQTYGTTRTFGCNICGGVLVEPVTFPVCFHSVCLACAQKKFSTDPSLSEIKCGFGCGTALKSTSLTVNVDLRSVIGGATLLEEQQQQQQHGTPTNAASLCTMCQDKPATFECQTCGMLCAKHLNKLHAMPAFKTHVAVALSVSPVVPVKKPPKYCRTHTKEKRQLFCKQCNELICSMCWIVGAHRQHECVDLVEGRKLLVPQLGTKDVYLSQRKAELMTFKSQLQTIKGETEEEERNRCKSITETITQVSKALEAKHNELCAFVERKQKSKVHTLEAQIQSVNDQISTADCGISCVKMSKLRVTEEDPFEFVSFGAIAMHATDSVTQFPSGSMLVPGASAQLEEAPLDCSHIFAVIRDLQLLPPVDATQSKIVRTETGPMSLGNEPIVVATIQVCDKTGKPSTCTSGLTCFCSRPGNDGVKSHILMEENAEKGQGHLTVRMTPSPTGDHTLTVKFNNVHIVGSPLVIPVVDRAFRGSKILTTRELDNKLHEMVVGAEGAMGHKMTNTTWRLLWRGSDHGFGGAKFHELCNNITPTLSIVRTTTNYICGGYTNIQFDNGDASRGGPDYGPTYGGGFSLYVCDNSNTTTGSYTSLSPSYCEQPQHNPPNEYLAGTYSSWLVSEIESCLDLEKRRMDSNCWVTKNPGDAGFCSGVMSSLPIAMVTAVDAAGKADICTVGTFALYVVGAV